MQVVVSNSPHVDTRTDRRKEQRYRVELHAKLHWEDSVYSVLIADVSGAGALLFLENPPSVGSKAMLWIEDFGNQAIEVTRTGKHFCGVSLFDRDAQRGRLLDWLWKEIAAGGPAAAAR